MEFYRCLFLDETDAVFGRTEFHAVNDDEASERAERHAQMNATARGYSLWQSGRLVVERGFAQAGGESRPKRAPPPSNR